MRLSIFSWQVSQILISPAPCVFTLQPCEGIKADVEIREKSATVTPTVWDEVYINGVWCGNRVGAVDYFTGLVNTIQPRFNELPLLREP